MSKTDFNLWASAPPSWVSPGGQDGDGTVISSRVRLARNLLGMPFPHHASAMAHKKSLEQILEAVKVSSLFEKSTVFQLVEMNNLERLFLVERQTMSHEHARKEGEVAVMIGSGEAMSVMINEEDHIRAACFSAGLGLNEAWDRLTQFDDDLASKVAFAYNAQLGYITACPTNIGTGLRASCLLHLPALVLTGKINNVIRDLSQSGLTARGFYGEGTTALGDFFQISNTVTLGLTEHQIIKSVEQAVKEIAAAEKKEEQNLNEKEWRTTTEDQIFRALGTLERARMLDYVEGMKCLSLVRLGVKLQWGLPLTLEKITQLYFLVQPAHLLLRQPVQKNMPTSDSLLRAQFVRSFLTKN